MHRSVHGYDLRKRWLVVTAVTGALPLTWAVTGNGTEPGITEAATPWGYGQAPAPSTEHRYDRCNDEFCERYICRVYREAWRDGLDEGRRRGFDEGFSAGFSEGLASCPGPLGGSA